jgi:excisionase family DNA binding protein
MNINILTEKEVQEILKIGDRQTKALFRTKEFPSMKIGREYRVLEDKFVEWLNQNPSVKLDYSKV